MSLPPDLFREVVDHLRPHCEREEDRMVLLYPLETVLPNSYAHIDLEGSPQVFCVKLVHLLQRVPPELDIVLAELVQFVGVDKQAALRDMRERVAQTLQSTLNPRADERQQMREELAKPVPDLAPVDTPKTEQPQTGKWRQWLYLIIGSVVLVLSLIWFIVERGFEPLIGFIAAFVALMQGLESVPELPLIGDMSRLRFGRRRELRTVLIERVETSWIEGYLQPALSDTDFNLGMVERPAAVLKHKELGDFEQKDTRNITRIADILERQFLILGAPGAGKTVLLLQLAQAWLTEARHDAKKLVPVVFNLASIASRLEEAGSTPLRDIVRNWLLDEFYSFYRVQRGAAGNQLDNNQVMLLLDGLDEVKDTVREKCVDAINEYMASAPYMKVIVCSRIADYDLLQRKLHLKGALLLEGLSDAQVQAYLGQAEQLRGLREILAEDSTLQAMATTPFLLNTMIYSYGGEKIEAAALRGYPTEDERRVHLFETYITRRFAEVGDKSPFTLQETLGYLRWLAGKMLVYVQTVFRPEEIAPYWLDENSLRWHHRLTWFTLALLLMPLYGLSGYVAAGWIGALLFMLVALLVVVVTILVLKNRYAFQSHYMFPGWQTLWRVVSEDKTTYGTLFVLACFLTGLASAYSGWWALLVVLVSLAVMGLRHISQLSREDAVVYTFLSVILVLGFSVWAAAAHVHPVAEGLLLGIWLIGVLLLLLSDKTSETITQIAPHWVVLLSAGITGLMAGLSRFDADAAMMLSLTVGVSFGLLYGWALMIQNGWLWVVIWQKAYLPYRLHRFLKFVTRHQIMRRLSGGHIFLHRALLESLAGLDEIRARIRELSDENLQEEATAALLRAGKPALKPLVNMRDSLFQQQILFPTEHRQLRNIIEVLDSLGVEGDPRSGVGVVFLPSPLGEGAGVRANGAIPQIEWCDVPMPPDGKVWLGHKDERNNQPREVAIPYNFKIAKYPVTYRQFQAFVDDPDGFKNARWWEGLADDEYRRQNQSQPGDQAYKYWNHPRERVSWYDAMAFCRWFSWRLGGGTELDKIETWAVRLPTEWEWEYAARGTDGRIYPYGNEFDAAKGNTSATGIGQTSAVGLFPDGASPCGALDMSGNVWEWCLNDYKNPEITDGYSNNNAKVLRGGSFNYSQDLARVVFRNDDYPNYRLNNFGFRLIVASLLPSLSSETLNSDSL